MIYGAFRGPNELQARILVKVAEKGIQAASEAFHLPGSPFDEFDRTQKLFLRIDPRGPQASRFPSRPPKRDWPSIS